MLSITLIAILASASIILFILAAGSWIIDRKSENSLSGDTESVFSYFPERMFSVFYHDKTPEEIATGMGLDVREYYQNCRIAKETPDLLHFVMHITFGIAICVVSLLLGLMTNIAVVLIGILTFYYIGYYPYQRLKEKVQRYRAEVADRLPAFLGLLKTELAIGLSIENAMLLIADRQNTRLAQEIKLVARKAELGSSGWVEALGEMAADYDIETLKTFVMNVKSAYEKGVSVAETIDRTAKDIRESHLLHVEEEAGKTTNYIIVPVVFLNLLPLILFMMIPVLFAMKSLNF